MRRRTDERDCGRGWSNGAPVDAQARRRFAPEASRTPAPARPRVGSAAPEQGARRLSTAAGLGGSAAGALADPSTAGRNLATPRRAHAAGGLDRAATGCFCRHRQAPVRPGRAARRAGPRRRLAPASRHAGRIAARPQRHPPRRAGGALHRIRRSRRGSKCNASGKTDFNARLGGRRRPDRNARSWFRGWKDSAIGALGDGGFPP